MRQVTNFWSILAGNFMEKFARKRQYWRLPGSFCPLILNRFAPPIAAASRGKRQNQNFAVLSAVQITVSCLTQSLPKCFPKRFSDRCISPIQHLVPGKDQQH